MQRGHAAISGFFLTLILTLAGCTGDLQQFVDEDKALAVTVVSSTVAAPTYSVQNRTLSFTVTLRLDRNGSYSVFHGSDCNATRQPAGVATTGQLTKDSDTQVSVAVSIPDIAAYGSKVVFCTADVANYKTSATVIDFSSAVTYFGNLNEMTGSGLVADTSTAFQLFQTDATSGLANRGGLAASNTASRPYHHAIFIDPNDDNRMKYFVADRDNHRVLIFNSLPTSNSAQADVVVGQTNFANVTANSGGGISPAGFDEPCGIAVTNSGALLIVDRVNNRVLVYNTIPTADGASADVVIGQPDMNSGTANNPLLSNNDKRLNDPVAVHVITGRVYIADRDNNRVLVFSSLPTSHAASASYVIGQPNFSSFGPGVDYSNSSYLDRPYELTVADNRLYLADGGNNRVLVFSSVPFASDARPDYVIGQAGPTGEAANQGSGSPAANTLNFPVGVQVHLGRLAIADQNNQRLLFYTLPITANNAAATHVLGQPNMTTLPTACSFVAASATTYDCPKSIVFGSGYIWVADQYNHRIQVMQLPY